MSDNPVDRFGPRTLEVACGGETHRVVWDRGRMIPLDHDEEAEEVLATLGGPREPCLALAALSRTPLPDAASRAVILGRSGASDLIGSAQRLEQAVAQYPTLARAGHFRATANLMRLLSLLGPGARELFWLHAAFRTPPPSDRSRDAEIRQQLAEAVRSTAPGSDISVRCEVVRETKTPHGYGLSDGATSAAAVFVQPSWTRIAGEGAAVLDGYAVLRLNPSTSRKTRRAWVLAWESQPAGLVARVARASLDPAAGKVRLLD